MSYLVSAQANHNIFLITLGATKILIQCLCNKKMASDTLPAALALPKAVETKLFLYLLCCNKAHVVKVQTGTRGHWYLWDQLTIS